MPSLMLGELRGEPASVHSDSSGSSRPALGFEREKRLLCNAQFGEVVQRKRFVHGDYFTFYGIKNSVAVARLGITVSKRVDKRAVQRNRIKRQVRESYRLNQHELVALDIVVLARVGASEHENGALREELDWLWPRLNERCQEQDQGRKQGRKRDRSRSRGRR